MTIESRRLLVVADSDSYVKWGAAFAAQRGAAWTSSLVLLKTPVLPSVRQLDAALAGTPFSRIDAHMIHVDDLTALIERARPHAVLLALCGPFVRVVTPVIGQIPRRPVIISRFPGLTIPAELKAVIYREQCDMIVLRSKREVRIESLGGVPDSFVVFDGPMADHLGRAAALVTVSSTAALEAIAAEIPVLLLDSFGIGPRQINTVFVRGGLFGSATDLARGMWQHPEPAWLDDNYFHAASDTTIDERLADLVSCHTRSPRAFGERQFSLTGGILRRAFERKRMLGQYDRSLSRAMSLVVALPIRAEVRRVRKPVRMLRSDPRHPSQSYRSPAQPSPALSPSQTSQALSPS